MNLKIVIFVVASHFAVGQTQIDKNLIAKVYLEEGKFVRKEHFRVSDEMSIAKKKEIASARQSDSLKYEKIIYLFKQQEPETVDELNSELKNQFKYLDKEFFNLVLAKLNAEYAKSRN